MPEPVLEQPAIPLVERNDDPDRNEPIVNAPVGDQRKVELDGNGFNLDRLFQEQAPRTKRKAAAEARDRIYGQLRFSDDIQYHPIPADENNREDIAC